MLKYKSGNTKSVKKDKSPQGFIDEDIKHLLDLINSADGYETTSSCSGRITLMNRQDKKESEWLFKSHSAVKADELWNALQNTSGRVWFMQEPVIIHVKCFSLESAEKLLNIAREIGMKHSGIVALGKEPILEIRGSERMEAILDKSLASREYIEILIEEANKKLLKAKEKINKLEKAVSCL
ncbi:MAG: tRNA wybutosine-synthesizing 3 family protein [Candidatus Nanoarchaeia archaeon]|nr:tRNA wybutosine-synthesizing 3 family protein [Candidatus Nanoarchaeia archaeon]